MGKKLTYTKAELNSMLRNIPHLNLSSELLTTEQQVRRREAIQKVNEAYAIYQKETGRK